MLCAEGKRVALGNGLGGWIRRCKCVLVYIGERAVKGDCMGAKPALWRGLCMATAWLRHGFGAAYVQFRHSLCMASAW